MKGKVAISNLYGFDVANVCDILRMQANGNYTKVFFKSGKQIISTQTLKYYANQLKEDDFCRTHKSHLVNMEYVTKYINGRNGLIEMADGSSVPISRTEKSAFLNRFKSGIQPMFKYN